MGDLGFCDCCILDGILDNDSVPGRIDVERVLTRVRGGMVELQGGRWNEAATVELRFEPKLGATCGGDFLVILAIYVVSS